MILRRQRELVVPFLGVRALGDKTSGLAQRCVRPREEPSQEALILEAFFALPIPPRAGNIDNMKSALWIPKEKGAGHACSVLLFKYE